MILLGIETSCDETSACVLEDSSKIRSHVIASQINLHQLTGGVVPEVASRHHVEQINGVMAEALERAGCTWADIGAVAVANRPGLLGALLVGVSAAKAVAYALDIPLLAVHHIEAHIYANWLVKPDLQFPAVCLVASGGHTELFLIRGHGNYQILGRTRDDAAGEAFDKSARLLGIPYPGGVMIDKLAREGNGNSSAIKFPRAALEPSTLDFSYSGLKTAVQRAVQDPENQNISREDWAASIQEAIIEPLVKNTILAAEQNNIKRVLLAGGVAANSRLQNVLRHECETRGYEFHVPPLEFCTDNAAMVACVGYYHWRDGKFDPLDTDTIASESLA